MADDYWVEGDRLGGERVNERDLGCDRFGSAGCCVGLRLHPRLVGQKLLKLT